MFSPPIIVNVNGQTSLACLPVVELVVPAGVELLEGGLHLVVSQVLADCHKLLQISELGNCPRISRLLTADCWCT